MIFEIFGKLLQSQNFRQITTYEIKNEITSMQFVSKSKILLVGDSRGLLSFIDTHTNEVVLVLEIEEAKEIISLKLLKDEKNLLISGTRKCWIYELQEDIFVEERPQSRKLKPHKPMKPKNAAEDGENENSTLDKKRSQKAKAYQDEYVNSEESDDGMGRKKGLKGQDNSERSEQDDDSDSFLDDSSDEYEVRKKPAPKKPVPVPEPIAKKKNKEPNSSPKEEIKKEEESNTKQEQKEETDKPKPQEVSKKPKRKKRRFVNSSSEEEEEEENDSEESIKETEKKPDLKKSPEKEPPKAEEKEPQEQPKKPEPQKKRVFVKEDSDDDGIWGDSDDSD